jgi:hypothetical protein
MGDAGERPPWDELAAQAPLGKDVLVGLTFERPNGEAIAETITESDDEIVPDWRRTLREGFEPADG